MASFIPQGRNAKELSPEDLSCVCSHTPKLNMTNPLKHREVAVETQAVDEKVMRAERTI